MLSGESVFIQVHPWFEKTTKKSSLYGGELGKSIKSPAEKRFLKAE
jgi:hypothetical protein